MRLSREATEIVLELIDDYVHLTSAVQRHAIQWGGVVKEINEKSYQELVALKLKQPTGEAVFYNADDTSGWKKAKGVIE